MPATVTSAPRAQTGYGGLWIMAILLLLGAGLWKLFTLWGVSSPLAAVSGEVIRYGVGHESAAAQRTVMPAKVTGPVHSVSSGEFTLEVYYPSQERRDTILANGQTWLPIGLLEPDGSVKAEMKQYGSSSLKNGGKVKATGLRWSVSLTQGEGDYWIPIDGSALFGGQSGLWIRWE